MIAFIPCSNKKIRDWDVPAWLMYLPSPSFQKVYNDAKRKAEKVFIISGKYGVLDPNSVISPYDAHIKNAAPEFVAKVRDEVKALHAEWGKGQPALSYCGKEYEKVLSGVPYASVLSGDMFARFGNLEKSQGPAVGSTLPIIKVVAWAYLNSGCDVEQLREWINVEYPHPVTRKCQFDRIFRSGFFEKQDGKVVYTGHPADKGC